jgi:hypothetical protein
VLIKSGHVDQVRLESDRWMRQIPDDLSAHVRLSEFWLLHLDITGGIDRLFATALRALDAGEVAIAQWVHDIVSREAPQDLRVVVLRDRIDEA